MTKGLWANHTTASVPRSISVSSLIKILHGDGLKLSLGPLSYTQYDIWERERESRYTFFRSKGEKQPCVKNTGIHMNFIGFWQSEEQIHHMALDSPQVTD